MSSWWLEVTNNNDWNQTGKQLIQCKCVMIITHKQETVMKIIFFKETWQQYVLIMSFCSWKAEQGPLVDKLCKLPQTLSFTPAVSSYLSGLSLTTLSWRDLDHELHRPFLCMFLCRILLHILSINRFSFLPFEFSPACTLRVTLLTLTSCPCWHQSSRLSIIVPPWIRFNIFFYPW